MATIFASYSHEDGLRVRQLVMALSSRGHDVWWDRELLPGQGWPSILETRLKSCDAAVVVWTSSSIASDYVLEEATRAKALGKLVPVAFDGASPPFGFGQVHTTDLSRWLAGTDGESISRVSAAAVALAQHAPTVVAKPKRGLKFLGFVVGGKFFGLAFGALAAGSLGGLSYLYPERVQQLIGPWWTGQSEHPGRPGAPDAEPSERKPTAGDRVPIAMLDERERSLAEAEQARLAAEAQRRAEERRLADAEARARQAGEAAEARARAARRSLAASCQDEMRQVARDGVIVFQFAKADIDAKSFATLNRLAEAANRCSSFKIEVGGHTDSDGTPERNRRLTEQRAQSVRNYLIKAGVSADRLTAVGYGDTKPVAPNDTPENKAKNRRIEFSVVGVPTIPPI